jgi:DNA replication protein DnaC
MPDRSGRGSPCCLIGDSGTGKSHLLIGLGIAAAEAGFRVRYVLAGRLVNELAEAENDRTLTKVIARYGRIDLLCLDLCSDTWRWIGVAELLFQVLTESEERDAIAGLFERTVQRLDKDVHRPTALHRDR